MYCWETSKFDVNIQLNFTKWASCKFLARLSSKQVNEFSISNQLDLRHSAFSTLLLWAVYCHLSALTELPPSAFWTDWRKAEHWLPLATATVQGLTSHVPRSMNSVHARCKAQVAILVYKFPIPFLLLYYLWLVSQQESPGYALRARLPYIFKAQIIFNASNFWPTCTVQYAFPAVRL